MGWSHRQIRPGRVFQAVTDQLNNAVHKNHPTREPPWYQIMHSVPPSESIIRKVSARHEPPSKRARKPKKLYRPQTLRYIEDSLRSTFFRDHPWELARPRIVVELDGKDWQRYDWSKGLRQPGTPLCGECVVQRQLWLMENEKMDRNAAYDVVRRDFYRLRQEEEIERRVALEEAEYVGSYFGKSRLEIGMLLEDKEYENWKVWAGKQAAARNAKDKVEVETFGLEENAEDLGDEILPEEEASGWERPSLASA